MIAKSYKVSPYSTLSHVSQVPLLPRPHVNQQCEYQCMCSIKTLRLFAKLQQSFGNSKLSFKNQSKFKGIANYMYCSLKMCSGLSNTANYCSKIHMDWHNRHHHKGGKFLLQCIISSNNALKSSQKPRKA